MKMQIGKWGRSLAVRLPKKLVERFRLEEGDEIDVAALEQALAEDRVNERQRQREEAIRRIAETRWTLPVDWKFDREEANAR